MEDEVVLLITPPDYWLKGGKTRCLLACMVHCSSKEISVQVTTLPPGQSREVQCNNAAGRVANEREMAKKVRKRDSDHEAVKKIQNSIRQMSMIKAQNEAVSTQLHLKNENKDAFIAALGEDGYNKKVVELLKNLPDPRLNTDNTAEEDMQEGAESLNTETAD